MGGIVHPATRSSPARTGLDKVSDALASPRTPFPNDAIPQTRLNATALIAVDAAPAADIPGSNNQYTNFNEVLRQDSNNYSIRAGYVLRTAVTLFTRYSASRKQDVTPGSTAGYSAIGCALPQNAALGATAVISPSIVNEARLGFNRMNHGSGVPRRPRARHW